MHRIHRSVRVSGGEFVDRSRTAQRLTALDKQRNSRIDGVERLAVGVGIGSEDEGRAKRIEHEPEAAQIAV